MKNKSAKNMTKGIMAAPMARAFTKTSIKTFALGQAIIFTTGSMYWLGEEYDSEELRGVKSATYTQAIHEAYVPSYVAPVPGNEIQELFGIRSNERAFFTMIYSIMALIFALGFGISAAGTARKNTRLIATQMRIWQLWSQMGMNREVFEQLMKETPGVVEKISSRNREFFDKIIEGEITLNSIKAVSAVIDGHLKKHPEDAKRIKEAVSKVILPQFPFEQYYNNARQR